MRCSNTRFFEVSQIQVLRACRVPLQHSCFWRVADAQTATSDVCRETPRWTSNCQSMSFGLCVKTAHIELSASCFRCLRPRRKPNRPRIAELHPPHGQRCCAHCGSLSSHTSWLLWRLACHKWLLLASSTAARESSSALILELLLPKLLGRMPRWRRTAVTTLPACRTRNQ